MNEQRQYLLEVDFEYGSLSPRIVGRSDRLDRENEKSSMGVERSSLVDYVFISEEQRDEFKKYLTNHLVDKVEYCVLPRSGVLPTTLYLDECGLREYVPELVAKDILTGDLSIQDTVLMEKYADELLEEQKYIFRTSWQYANIVNHLFELLPDSFDLGCLKSAYYILKINIMGVREAFDFFEFPLLRLGSTILNHLIEKQALTEAMIWLEEMGKIYANTVK